MTCNGCGSPANAANPQPDRCGQCGARQAMLVIDGVSLDSQQSERKHTMACVIGMTELYLDCTCGLDDQGQEPYQEKENRRCARGARP